jgi:hypothetical protein
VRFDKHPLDRGFLLLYPFFQTRNGRLQLLNIQPAPESNTRREQHLLWAQLHGQQIAHAFHGRVAFDDFARRDVQDSFEKEARLSPQKVWLRRSYGVDTNQAFYQACPAADSATPYPFSKRNVRQQLAH